LGDSDGRSNLIEIPITSTPPARIFYWAFFTKQPSVNANLEGLSGADTICANAAIGVGAKIELSGRKWMAWLSDSNTNAIDRISNESTDLDKPYYTPTDLSSVKVFDSLNSLISCSGTSCLLTAFHAQNGEAFDFSTTANVFTSTKIDGTALLLDNNAAYCLDWTTSSTLGSPTPRAYLGDVSGIDSDWTFAGTNQTCDQPALLYCFEVGP